MLRNLLIALCLACAANAIAQAAPQMANVPTNMKPYFIGLFVHGENWTDGASPEAKLLLADHLAFIREKIEKHQYLIAGPVLENGDIAGVAIISAASAAEAKAIADADPEVRTGRLAVQLHPVLLPDLASVHVAY